MQWLAKLALLILVANYASAQSSCEGRSCFPSTGDLLVGRGNMLHATSTCGLDGEEDYCIVSHLKDVQKCFTCDASNPGESHNVQNVITTFNDRLQTWWQSENGKQKVSIQLDLEAEFQFTHMIMTFKTFRPAAMFIERSMDFGKTWNVYRYFAYDCERSFPSVSQWPPQEIDDVVCDSRYSMIEPSNQGEVIYRVLEPFIHIDDPYAPQIQNLLKITNLRVNFTELHTLGDDLLDAREDIKSKYYYALYELIVRGNCFCYGHADTCTPIHPNEVVTGVHDVMLLRRDYDSGQRRVHGRCQCQHNTMGLNCEQCMPFYQDQPWRPAEAGMPHECQPCNCNGHATECHFDPAVYEATGGVSGGVCDNCQHNTVGRRCEQCAAYYYQNPQKDVRDPTVCEECNCEVAGSLDGGICDSYTNPDQGMIAGQCRCKRYVEGPRCDRCKAGYYGLDDNNPDGCTACDCDSLGTLSGANTCDPVTGQCNCKRYTTGRRCDMCLPQTWGMSAISQGCNECDCDIGGAYDDNCDQRTGQCRCRPNINNRRCDIVVSGNFLPALDHYLFEAEDADIVKGGAFPDIRTRDRPPVTWTGNGFMMVREGGAISFTVSGLPASMDYHLILRYQSNKPNQWKYVEVTIDRPNRGNIPTHSPCGNTRPEDDSWMTSLPGPPTTHSNLGIICLEQNYTYRVIVDLSRYQEEPFPDDLKPDILIDSLLVVPVHTGVDMFQRTVEGQQRARQFDELQCLDEEMAVPDRIPREECGDLMFSMSAIIHDGARPCDCDLQGSESSICNDWGGQCRCKRNVIGRRCDRCAPGTYGFGPSGCRPCDCDARGSSSQFCDRASGQCVCHAGVSGRRCDRCKAGHFRFPHCSACVCNGHADSCNQDTGICNGCRDNTEGDHCETCVSGYYGNPVLGSVDQCKPCMCPGGPNSGRQFATGCRFNHVTAQLQCFCLPGYAGPRCDECAPAHWGNPGSRGGLCRECDCNGNVDTLDPNACDAATGVCTGCLYDTAGVHCERCRDFYFGSALDRTCRACACSLLGTHRSYCVGDQCRCDEVTGQCTCLPNVAGQNCDRCEPNHWKLASGEGCEACNCNLDNSEGPSCNEFTGQCQCVEGFGGKTCNDCAYGHFGNPNIQCYSCDCDVDGSVSDQCNSRTGQCECKEGVGGRRCNRCLRGFTGRVPNCEPCGECFDNWDDIINGLKERTEQAIADARKIGETGVTGSFEKEFQEIERVLDSIPHNFTGGTDELENLITTIKEKLAEQESRLRQLEEDMDGIRSSDETVNDDLDGLDEKARALEKKLDALKNQKQNISKTSPVAAFKQIEDAAQASQEAEERARAATTDPGSLVEQSRDIREEVEGIIDEKKREFDDKLDAVEEELQARQLEVGELAISELNKDVCGKATEECDESCGGAGCATCGGIGCEGALQFAKDAKNRAQRTQDILTRVSEETNDLNLRVMTAKANAEEAKEAARAAKTRAEEVEAQIHEQNLNIRKLIQDIRKFLSDDRADPADIGSLAQQVLDLKLPVTKSKINEMAAQINDLIARLPDVDNLLNETADSLALANRLLNDATKAKASAIAVADDVQAVTEALEDARLASEHAEVAKEQARTNIRRAHNKIEEIKSATVELSDEMNGISERIADLDARMGAIESKISDNQFNLESAQAAADEASSTAQGALDALSGKQELINNATRSVEDKSEKTTRIKALRNNAQNLQQSVNGYLTQLTTLDNQFSSQERELRALNDELGQLSQQAQRLYDDISELEEYLRTCK